MKKLLVILLVAGWILTPHTAAACTNFQVKAKDGTVVIARSNEFPIDAHSEIVFEPAGKSFASKGPADQAGESWTSRYAFLGINGMGLKENFIDGMNSAGLSAEGLLFTEGQYETETPGENRGLVSSNDFIAWVLGQFATVEEVKTALASVRVWGETVPAFGKPLPLHFSIHDASGKSLVIEFIGGEKKFYDNPVGVMTNMPEFPWHLTHLRSFVNLEALNPEAKDFNGLSVAPIGQGTGWLGLPGDWSPPSRFVRVAYLANATSPAKDRDEALTLAKHILNTVDIPAGSIVQNVKDKTGAPAVEKEYTQWTVLNDLTNRVMYYSTYGDLTLRSVDLKTLADAGTAEAKFIPMSERFSAADQTDKLTKL